MSARSVVPSRRLAPRPPRLEATSLLVLALVVLGAGACSRKIGDACATNVDCSPLGDRFCDLSSPAGYCTIEGCDQTSCTNNDGNAVCVRFFSLQRGTPVCNAARIPRSDCHGEADCCQPGTAGCCRLGERCLCDDEACTRSFCASETSEHRWCMHSCESSSDCRDGYDCYATNQGGTSAVTMQSDAGVVSTPIAHYCAPKRAN